MKKLEELKALLMEYVHSGCYMSYGTVSECVEEVFGYAHPHIHRDGADYPSHMFFENSVIFFDDRSIYFSKK